MCKAGSANSDVLKKTLLALAFVLLLLSVSGWYGWQRYSNFLRTPLDVAANGQVFQLQAGTTGADIVNQMGVLGLTRPAWEWRLLMRLEPHVYRAGEYRLDAGISPQEVLGLLSSGQVIQYRFTLVEGWTFQQLATALAANTVLKHELDLETPSQWPALSSELGIGYPEGWFLPETYQFTRGDSDRDVLVRAHASMEKALDEAWESRIEDLPIDSPYQMLILASIIEKETSLDEERAWVAGVFTRRLNKGMRLQTDPTVIYGMGDSYDGDIRRRDLQTDTPYNTYTRHGLPPTPISMPGKASLMAAARPATGEALYFVADGDGGHTFSATLEAHQEAVRKFMERK
jgi:UPF0755 protein